jgi:hypothetical protein
MYASPTLAECHLSKKPNLIERTTLARRNAGTGHLLFPRLTLVLRDNANQTP